MITLFCACTATKPKGYIDKNEIYLEYIFYKSLQYAYNNDSLFMNDASAGVLMDLSGFSILGELGDYLDNEAKRRADKIEPHELLDYRGKKPIFIDLLGYYENKELSKKILKEIKLIRRKGRY
ncbi:MAG TPA: hypothetical protein PK110_08215 [Niabella sp.]|nr:hypothetical protein [Chitinophagaceae bacterium]HRN46901.1 hypothetical protein [Niabella sp.]HRO84788.1 hypothetical protein [Niabella sp.]HUN01613.1 hypothetical protein [Niabella sp.]